MKCILIGNGAYHNEIKDINNCFIVAVDGGYNYLKHQGIKPNVIIGDMDSIEEIDETIEQIKYPSIKNKTDMQLALEYVIEKGFDDIYLFAALGKRIEHSYANLNLLYLFKDYNIKIIDNDLECFVKNKGIYHIAKNRGYISIFSLTNESIISIEGLKYELKKEKINNIFPLGLDNEAIDQEAVITIHEGTILIMTRFIK